MANSVEKVVKTFWIIVPTTTVANFGVAEFSAPLFRTNHRDNDHYSDCVLAMTTITTELLCWSQSSFIVRLRSRSSSPVRRRELTDCAEKALGKSRNRRKRRSDFGEDGDLVRSLNSDGDYLI